MFFQMTSIDYHNDVIYQPYKGMQSDSAIDVGVKRQG